MVVPVAAAAREGGRNGGAESSIANAPDDASAAALSTPTPTSSSSSSSFLPRLPRPPPARVLLSEASGAVGDLGTFLPLTLGLVAAVRLDFGTTLIFTGIYNIVSGLVFGVPMPVQPMKTIAAVAVASISSSTPITLEEVTAAGMFVSAVVLFLGITRLVDVVNRAVPRSVVAGLQLGVGLKLASSGVKSVFLAPSSTKNKTWRAVGGVEGWALGAAALAFLFVSTVARGSGKDGVKGYPSDSSLPSFSSLPRRLREALLERKRRRQKQRGGDDSSSSSSSGGSSGGSGASAKPSLPLASPPPPPPPPAVAPAADAAPEEDEDSSPSWQVPSALLVTLLGAALAFATAPAAARRALRLGPSTIVAAVPTKRDWLNGITRAGGLAQLPLTTLNSVIAVSHLADSLYGGSGGSGESGTAAPAAPSPSSPLLRPLRAQRRKDASRWRPSRVAIAVGLYNLLGGWFGAMPACMGSGGLAAQHKFGARGGAAPVLLGAFKISLALLFGSSLSSVLRFFPSGLLGAMLALAGAELAAAARAAASGGGEEEGGEKEKNSALSSPRFFAFAALTAAAIFGLDDPAAGFAVGWSLWLLTEAWERGISVVKRGAWRREKEKKETSDKSCEV